MIAFWPACVQQIGGLAVLSSYSSYFAQTAGFADPFLFSLLLSLVALATTVIEAGLIDLLGRRMLFLIAAVSTWSMCIIVGGLGLAPNKSHSVNQLVVSDGLNEPPLTPAVLLPHVAPGLDVDRESGLGVCRRNRLVTIESQDGWHRRSRWSLLGPGLQHDNVGGACCSGR